MQKKTQLLLDAKIAKDLLNILCGRNVRDYINKYTGRAEGRVIEAKAYQGEV